MYRILNTLMPLLIAFFIIILPTWALTFGIGWPIGIIYFVVILYHLGTICERIARKMEELMEREKN